MFRRTFFLTLASLGAVASAFGYGSQGHTLVGAIADDRLAETPTAPQIATLLDGITLAQAAVLPDQIKSWDRSLPSPGGKGFRLTEHPAIEEQLIAFVKANPAPKSDPDDPEQADPPSHHWFHYTDVPVAKEEKYADGKIGRSRWDIAHMIDFCIRVLEGKEPAENPRAITKPVAIILLAHYLGDVHQPLHVGAEYFDKSGNTAIDPTADVPWLGDAGGNTLLLVLRKGGDKTSLHRFWDTGAVVLALDLAKKQFLTATPRLGQDVSPEELAAFLAQHPPTNWQVPAEVPLDELGPYLVNDTLPLAREAHERLSYRGMRVMENRGTKLASGTAFERAMPDGVTYVDWAAKVTETNLIVAGCRLADLLERLFPAAALLPVPAAAPAQTAAPVASPAP